jgi:hypothetical protein
MIKLLDILKEVQSLNEEYTDGQLIGYHITNKSVVDNIAKDGFRVGERKMQGKGFYAFYDRKHAIGYAMKDAGDSGTVIVSFYVKNPEYNVLYLNMDIAKDVLGDEYHLKDQIANYFEYKGGLTYFLEQVRLGTGNKEHSMDELLEKLDDIESNNSEGNQRTLIFQMIPADLNNSLNIVWNGNYGLEFRFNNVDKLVPFKYEELIKTKGRFEPVEIEPGYSYINDVLTKIPNTSENAELRNAIMDSDGTKIGLKRLKNKLEDLLDNARNNRDFNKYEKMIDQLNKVGI